MARALANELHMCQSRLARAIDESLGEGANESSKERAVRALRKKGEEFASDRERWAVATKALVRGDHQALTMAAAGLDKEAGHELCAYALEGALDTYTFNTRAEQSPLLARALRDAGFDPCREGKVYGGEALAARFTATSSFMTALGVEHERKELRQAKPSMYPSYPSLRERARAPKGAKGAA